MCIVLFELELGKEQNVGEKRGGGVEVGIKQNPV